MRRGALWLFGLMVVLLPVLAGCGGADAPSRIPRLAGAARCSGR
jgi:hypothetical protein